jgi:D-alanyl-D-alanine carboxypeptidase/D-alanyl-D-alanine-endopeptidase (penicillin-binding protein 4)
MLLLSRCLLLALLFSAAANRAAAEGPFDSIQNEAEFRHAHWGLLVADLETGEVLHEHNADKLFVPASTTKLYSVAAALDALGADHRFKTPVHRRGEMEGGVLRGDLILVAQGDLTMGGRTTDKGEIAFDDHDHTYADGDGKTRLTDPDPLAGLDDLAKQIADLGIRAVEGDVLIDDRLFDKETSTGSGPQQLTPILINDNVIDVIVTPSSPGGPASVDWRPKGTAIQVDADVVTAASDEPTAILIRAFEGNRVSVRGRIAAGRPPAIYVVETGDPASFARSLFIDALNRAGVKVSASALDANDIAALPSRDSYATFPKVAELVSPSFSEEMRLVLKVSHNLHASTLPMLVASSKGKRTLADGLRAEHEFLVRLGVEADSISFGGGAGGSRADYVTPRATVQLLRAMSERTDFEAYFRALPVLGVDGTLAEHAGPDSAARGKVHAKTGTLYWTNTLSGGVLMTSKALAGYLDARSGKRLAFAFFLNNVQLERSSETTRMGKVLGSLCERAWQTW